MVITLIVKDEEDSRIAVENYSNCFLIVFFIVELRQ